MRQKIAWRRGCAVILMRNSYEQIELFSCFPQYFSREHMARKNNEFNMDATEELQDERVPKYFVFFCLGCRTIFGDSISTVRMNKNLKSISLNGL